MKANLLTTVILLTSTAYAVDSKLLLRHRESQGVGYNKGYTTLDYFLTSQGEKTEILFNLRGHLFNDGKAAGNAGFGVRYSLASDTSRIGANIFYDFRDYSHFFAHQVAGGFEWISRAVDVRVNGYLPVGKQKNFQVHKFQNFVGNHVLTKRKFSASLPNIEGEVGTAVANPFYFAVGTYYLFRESSHSVHVGEAWGGKARFDINMGRYLTLGAVVTHDRIFKTRVQGYLSVNIPLGPWKSTQDGPRDLRHVPIVRNEIIPVQTRKDSKVPLVLTNDQPLSFLFVNNKALSSGDGTFEYPFSSLKEAERYSQSGDIIYVYPGDGTPHGMDEGIVLKENQILASSGSPLEIDTLFIPAQTPGENPILTNIHENEPIVSNPGLSNLDNFYFMDPWEYLRNYDFQLPSISLPLDASAPVSSPSSISSTDAPSSPASIDSPASTSLDNTSFDNGSSVAPPDVWNDPALDGWVDLGSSTSVSPSEAPSSGSSQGGIFNFIWDYSGQQRN